MDAIRAATPDQFAQVAVTWTSTMGLRYPDDVVITSADATTTPNNAATVPATDAFRAALLAGSRVAATGEAIRRLEAEIGLTRRRLRALDKRLIPWLRAELAALELTLEQSEQEDGMRLRRPLRGVDLDACAAAQQARNMRPEALSIPYFREIPYGVRASARPSSALRGGGPPGLPARRDCDHM